MWSWTPTPRCSAGAGSPSAIPPIPMSARCAWLCPALVPGAQPGRRSRRIIRLGTGSELSDQPRLCIPSQELLLRRPCPRTIKSASSTFRSAWTAGWTWSRTGEPVPGGDRAGTHGGGHRQVGACGRGWEGSTPRRRPWWTSTGPALPLWRSSPVRIWQSAARCSDLCPGAYGPSWLRQGVSDARDGERARSASTPMSRYARRGSPELGVKVEIKNMNSFRSLEKAIRLRNRADRPALRTAGGEGGDGDPTLGRGGGGSLTGCAPRREAPTYRYFTEPDLAPMVFDSSWVEEVRSLLPELPLSAAIATARWE